MKRNVSTGSPTLDYVIRLGIPKDLWAVAWLYYAYGHIPEFIGGEELENVPGEISDEITERYFPDLEDDSLIPLKGE